ncbi:MAG: amino acid adenylation domain-containing protein, partial [Geminicoccaceae bacterium]
GYGPTENTTFSTCHRVTAAEARAGAIPIGRPIRNSTAYVLDPAGLPVPPGVVGELHVGGDGLARGYLNDPQLTAARFARHRLSHPGVAETVETRLYATGDLVRWREDGTLDFMGRADRQLKLHGLRVEPGEIEAALAAQPEILQAAVRPIERDAHVRLGAWYACRPGAELAEAELRARLEAVLPAYLVPAVLVRLPSLPIKASGKIDLDGLPEPASAADGPVTEADGVAGALLAIWRRVLRNEALAPDDDFFMAGGDSILSIQVVAQARALGLRFLPRDIFETRTVARLAARAVPLGQPALPVEAVAAPPLTPIQRWFFGLDLPAPHHFNQAFLLLPRRPVTAERLGAALARLVQRHEALGLRFHRQDGGSWRQTGEGGGTPCIESWRMPAGDGAALQRQLTAWQAGFDLADGPLLAAGIVEGHPDGRQRVLLALHHLVVDIVSWRVLLDELATLLAAPAAELPPAGAGFRTWAQALTRFATAPEALAGLDHWCRALRPAGALPSGPDTAGLTLRLDRDSTDGLLHQAGRAYGTRVHELLLAALAPAVAQACGGQSAALMLEGHGREDVLGLDVAGAVGWFTTRFPLRLDLPDADPASLVPAVKRQLRAVPHNGLSYGVLRDLSPDPAVRAALAGPEPAITFNYLGQLDGLGGGDWQPAPEPPGEMVAPANPPASPLDITALVVEGQLEVRLTVGRHGLPAGWARDLARDFLARLGGIVAHCRGLAELRRTGLDFPEADLPDEEIDRLLAGCRTPPETICRLTPLQEGLLFHALHSPSSDQYVVQATWRCAAPLEPSRLRQAWLGLVQAHDVLRTRFAWHGLAHPVQLVEATAEPGWRVLDLTDRDEVAQAQALAAEQVRDRAAGLDLAQPCAMRVTLVRLAPASWAMVWTYHHILLDGWCVPLLLDELGRRYAAARQDEAGAGAGGAPPAYRRYVGWLRRQDRPAALEFWRHELAEVVAPTDIPVPRPGAVLAAHVPVRELGSCRQVLDEALSARLVAFARGQGVTLNAVFQLAWGCLLAAYAGGSRDVLFGTVVSGRANDFPGIERLIGLAANVLPVRLRLQPRQDVAAALRATHATIEAASARSHVSLADIQGVSGVPAGSPLFHSVLVFENYPAVGAASAALGAGAAEIVDKTSFPLLAMVLPGAGLGLVLHYDLALFAPATIEAMAGHLVRLLGALADDPHGSLDRLELVTPAERRWLIEGCNATRHPLDAAATMPALIAAQAARTPEAVAVEDAAGRTLSYAALERAANGLAHRLRAGGIGPDARVGICLERGLALVVAILAAMKAGGAYVPLDPDHPPERLAFVAEDSGCAVIVTTAGLAPRLVAGCRQMLLDEASLDLEADEPPLPGPAPDDLAYVLYTSGSTGRPKGAMIEHRSLVNRILWMQASYPLGSEDRVLQKTPFSFDVSVWEFVWPLLTGARLVLARPGGHKDPAYLARLILERRITTLHFVPSMLRVFLEVVALGRLGCLRRIFCSGEALPAELPRQVLSALPMAELHNLYGPTEAAIDVSHHACVADEPGSVVPIGRPVWNTQLHVLDALMRPQPVGVPGELWIGGVQVGRGYLNRPELTAERFVPDPFGPGRLYRTGDLVRRGADGSLDYLGRTDFQVKVRGVRIELAEIEAALERVAGIRQALVLARPVRGELELLAYLATGAQAPTDAAIRAELARSLPDAMVPGRFVRLERLPLNSAGKVDRAALPEPGDAAPVDVANAADGGTVAATLARIFAEILGRPVGPGEDFFALGGHSLHVVRAVARIRQHLGVELPLASLFERRTALALARLVAELAAVGAEGEGAEEVPRLDRSGPLPVSPAQERLWFLDRLIADPATYNVPVALRLDGPLDFGALAEALEGLVAAHEVLRARIVAVEGRPRLRIAPMAALPLTLESVSAEGLAGRLAELARQPFLLAEESPIRAHLLRLAARRHVLLLNQHHAITDGWSLALLLRELGQRYRAAVAGEDQPPAAADRPQFADLAAWERQRLAGPRGQDLLDFWCTSLRDAPMLELPADLPRPAVMSCRGGVVRFALPAELGRSLRAAALAAAATPFALLLGAFAALLGRWTGQRDLVVATPVANRTHPAQMEALGLFVSTLALRVRLGPEERPFADLATRLAADMTAALAHQDLPFDRLLGALGVPREAGRPPLTPVLFILQNAGDLDGFAAPELAVERVPVDTGTAKFELTLSLEDEADGALAGVLEFAADLFLPATVERLAEGYARLLHGVAAMPATSLRELLAASGLDRAAGVRVVEAVTAPSAVVPPPVVAAPANDRPADLAALVAAIWCEVLGLDRVPLDRNFFDLGGTSLGLMRVQAQLEQALGREVSVLDLFAQPTVARLAAHLGQAAPAAAAALPHHRPQRRARRGG